MATVAQQAPGPRTHLVVFHVQRHQRRELGGSADRVSAELVSRQGQARQVGQAG